MQLKYQYAFNERNLNPPPPLVVDRTVNYGCRFIKLPLDQKLRLMTYKFPIRRGIEKPIKHNCNFLPSIVIDKLLGHKFPYDTATHEQIWPRCSVSLYDCIENAHEAWKHMPVRVKAKWGFTHVAHGEMSKLDGLISATTKEGHFDFYEELESDIITKFTVVEPLK